MKKQYPYSAFHRAPAAGGFAFLSKTPLRNVKHHALRVGWFGAYVAETTLGGETIRIVNLHLQPTLPDYGESLFRFMLRWRRTVDGKQKNCLSGFVLPVYGPFAVSMS